MARAKLTILLVEHRDEVFARIASDLAAGGILVQRVSRGAEASRIFARSAVDLVLVNAELPDESGWLLSKKLRMLDAEACIWIYTPRASAADVSMANFVMADELIEYHGDLWRLAGEIADRLGVSLGTTAESPSGGVPAMHAFALA
ncbi:MAG: response regulator [Thermoguttaceae bacterium]